PEQEPPSTEPLPAEEDDQNRAAETEEQERKEQRSRCENAPPVQAVDSFPAAAEPAFQQVSHEFLQGEDLFSGANRHPDLFERVVVHHFLKPPEIERVHKI